MTYLTVPERPHYVYEFYAEDGSCLYVGCSWRFKERLQQHHPKHWWIDVTRIEINKHPDLEAGREAEAQRIKLLNPLYNKRIPA